jgi:hypothetical protein
MSFRNFIAERCVANVKGHENLKNFYALVIPGNASNIYMFEDWLFEMNHVDRSAWDQAYESNDTVTLNEIIMDFEDLIIQNFARMCVENLVIIEDGDIYEKFRSEICSLYVCIFSEYIESVYKDFESTTVRVYQDTYEEQDEGVC